jgi:hypothetical protein
MPDRPLCAIDLQRVPPVPRLRAVVVPPPLPQRPRAILPSPGTVVPGSPAPRLALNWKAVAAAGVAAVLLVGAALTWAATHPRTRSPAAPVAPPVVLAAADVAAPRAVELAPAHERGRLVSQSSWSQAEEDGIDSVPLPPAAPPVLRVPAPVEEPVVAVASATCDTFGTSVEFDANPVRAAKQAAKAQKLLMVLHVSGNFEESAFT